MQEHPALTKQQQVVAQAVATTLEPLLKELNRRLDAMNEQLDTMLAELAVTAARVEEVVGRNGTMPHN